MRTYRTSGTYPDHEEKVHNIEAAYQMQIEPHEIKVIAPK